MISTTLRHAMKLHKTGDIDQAEASYLDFLETEPNNTDALQLLGILYGQQKEFEKALPYLEKAFNLDPNSSSIMHNLAIVYKNVNKIEKAEALYKKSIELTSNFPAAHNNLGILLYERGDNEKAIMHYKTAIKQKPDYADAYFNLGIVEHLLDNDKQAEKAFQQTIELDPTYYQAYVQLGKVYHLKKELTKALEAYQKAFHLHPEDPDLLTNIACVYLAEDKPDIALQYLDEALTIDPKHAKALYNLGTIYLVKRDLNKALKYYLQLLQNKPDENAYYNVGVIYMYQSRYIEAIEYFNKVLEQTPNHYNAQLNLAGTYLKQGKNEQAIAAYKKAKALAPDKEEINYLLAALTQETLPTKAPNDYIKSLFDEYAFFFDEHLQKSLAYQVPQLLYEDVTDTLPQKTNKLTILDLGCGTGLAGEKFKPLAKKLIGIDISERMLAVAKEKNCYDELREVDIETALKDYQKENIDLLLAADVFSYIGDLSHIFSLAHDLLTKEGLFAFTVEKSETEDYSLQTTARYCHSSDYIQKLAKENHFEIVVEQLKILRTQQRLPVYGYVYVCKN